MTTVYHSPLSLQRFSSEDEFRSHHIEVVSKLARTWEMRNRNYRSRAQDYRLFRLYLKQAILIREQMLALKSWNRLQDFINGNFLRLYANPASFFDIAPVKSRRPKRLELHRAFTDDVAKIHEFYTIDLEGVNFGGSGYRFEAKLFFHEGSGRFIFREFADALFTYGLLATEQDYQPAHEDSKGEHVEAHYDFNLYVVSDDWPGFPRPRLSDAEILDQEDDEDLEIDGEDELPDIFNGSNDDPNDEILKSYESLIV